MTSELLRARSRCTPPPPPQAAAGVHAVICLVDCILDLVGYLLWAATVSFRACTKKRLGIRGAVRWKAQENEDETDVPFSFL